MHMLQAEDIPQGFEVAIIVSRFNELITHKLLEGAVGRLKELNITDQQITGVWVPGAVEIPLTAQRLAKKGKYDVIICLGAVIFGETKHFDYVCDQVSQGCQQVALTHNIPVIFGVLTTDNIQQALDRVGGSRGHMGRAAAEAAYELVSVFRQIDHYIDH